MAGAAILAGCLLLLGPWRSSSERGSRPAEAAEAAIKTSVPAAAALSGLRAVLVSPQVPRPGGRLRVLAAFKADPAKVQAFLRGPAGVLEPLKTKRGGGPPFWVAAEFPAGDRKSVV